LLFDNVNGFDMPVLGGVFSTRKRAFLALETSNKDYVNKFQHALDHLVAPKLVAHAPCKEVVYKGKDVDLNKLPVPIFSEKDPAPFITLACVSAAISNRREKYLHLSLAAQRSQSSRHYGAASGAATDGSGVDRQRFADRYRHRHRPVLPLATQWMAPYGTDELALAGSLRGAPVEVVPAETVDLEVPATAEIIIEGMVLPNVREEEGPFGEVSGYYTPSNPKPVIEVTAITHRRNPIYQAALTGMPTTENHILKQLPLEATYYWQLKKEFPGVTAVHFPAAGTVGMTCVIAMKQAYECEARNLIAAMIGTRRNKITVVVDDDVDITDMEKVWWAIATRTQADEDVIVFPRVVATAMDPSVRKLRVGSSLGIDATVPFGSVFRRSSRCRAPTKYRWTI
jgi:4-hydroxy-3-polyprenylbenzoate decarboxylase/2,5-furandicarboxylate decarboxylase 1